MIMETRESHAKSNKLREEDNAPLKPKYCNMFSIKKNGLVHKYKKWFTLKQT